jgi:thiol:disulfide interchange protein DsbA
MEAGARKPPHEDFRTGRMPMPSVVSIEAVLGADGRDGRPRRLARLFVVLLLAGCAPHAGAGDVFKEGSDYVRIPRATAPADTHKVLVQEFFWYGCPHCFAFDPDLQEWLSRAPRDVAFERVPDTLGRPAGVVHARAFYIAQRLGISDAIHVPLFGALHDGSRPLDTLADVRGFFGEKALVAPAAFDHAADDPLVESQLRRAEELARNYGVTKVPTMVVDGRYRTDGEMAGGLSHILDVVGFLVDKSRKERAL